VCRLVGALLAQNQTVTLAGTGSPAASLREWKLCLFNIVDFSHGLRRTQFFQLSKILRKVSAPKFQGQTGESCHAFAG
jgi:hypothetical protein